MAYEKLSDLKTGLSGGFDIARDEENYNLHQEAMFLHNNGMETGGTLRSSSVIAGGAASGIMRAQLEAKADEDRKNNLETQVLLAALKSLDQDIAALGQKIDGYEADFTAQYGDAWREIFANKILDPDDIPERLPNESMEDYRARLEPILMAEMLDEDGQIKQKYKDDPEMSAWANWAKAQHDQQVKVRQRDILLDGGSPKAAQRQVIVEIQEENDLNQNNQLDQDLALQGASADIVKVAEVEIANSTDNKVELVASGADDMAAFFGGGPS